MTFVRDHLMDGYIQCERATLAHATLDMSRICGVSGVDHRLPQVQRAQLPMFFDSRDGMQRQKRTWATRLGCSCHRRR